MRLINVKTNQLEEFAENEVPDYVILSHTWGKSEVSFQQYVAGKRNPKIIQCCVRAAFDGFEYVWVDTCCINKDSSAELSEAINSMYKWYATASICYAFLEDFPASIIADGAGGDPMEVEAALAKCRWFTRGWTLQELIAPSVVEFYAQDWSEIGTKMSLQSAVSRITSIPVDVLTRMRMPRYYNVAERMSWAARRQTTRLEDEAYCLMGLFDVHMPMIYGEKRRAFRRLQEEILKLHEDYSLFAWPNLPVHYHGSLFAPSPAEFVPGEIPFSELENISPAMFPKQERSLNTSSFSFRDKSSKTDTSAHGKHDHIIPPPSITSRGVCVTLPIVDWKRPDPSESNCLAAICVHRAAKSGNSTQPANGQGQSSNTKDKNKTNTPHRIVFIQLKRKDKHFRTFIRTHVSVLSKHPSFNELIPQSFGIRIMDATPDWLSQFTYSTLFVEDHGDSENQGVSSDHGADTAVDVRFSSSSASAATTPIAGVPESPSGSGPSSSHTTPSIPPSVSLGPEATCSVSLVKFFDPRPPFAFEARQLPGHKFKPFGGLSGVLVFAANASNISNATINGQTSGSDSVAGAPITVSFGARNDAPWCSVVCGKSIGEVENLACNLRLTELLNLAAGDHPVSNAHANILNGTATFPSSVAGLHAAVALSQRRATQTDRCRVRLTPRGVNPVFWMDVSIRKGFRPKGSRRQSDLATRSVSGAQMRVEDKFIVHVNVVKDFEIVESIPSAAAMRAALAEREIGPFRLGQRVSTM